MLTDFGIAKVLDLEETADLTGTGMGIGTPEYMAPEQWTGNTTPQSDLYSLGVVLYEMITGRKPYTAETPAAILLKQATEPLPRPSGLVSDLSDKVEKILIKALARDPKDRYKDMGEFAKAVEGSLKLTSSPVERAKLRPVSKPTGKTLDTMATVDQEWEETRTPQSVTASKGKTRTETKTVDAQQNKSSSLPWYKTWQMGAGVAVVMGLVVFCSLMLIGYVFSRPATPVPVRPSETTVPTQSPTVMVQSTTIPSTLVPTIVANPNNAQGSSAEVTVADCAKPEVLCVGLVTDVGRVNDKSFNQSAWEGVLKAKEDGVADLIQYIETSDWNDYDKNIAQFADAGFDVIVTVGFGLGEATQTAALKYPNIWFIGVDQFQAWEYDNNPSTDIPNVSGLNFPEDHAGFLVGALAAMMSESHVIGAVCGTDVVPPVWRFGEGYRAGAAYADTQTGNRTEVLVAYHSNVGFDKTFTDPEWGAQTAKSMMDQGADAIFGCGGITGNGAIIAAARSGEYAIGVDIDQYFTLPEAAPRMLSSALKLIAPGVADLIAQVKSGSIQNGNVFGNAGYAPFHDLDGKVPADVKTKMQEIDNGLRNGSIKTNVSPIKP